MKEYICVDDTYKNLDKDERKVFLKLVSKTMHYTKADICEEFIDHVKFCEKTYMKPQVVRHPEYYKGYKDAFRFFEQILSENKIEQVLAEMESE